MKLFKKIIPILGGLLLLAQSAFAIGDHSLTPFGGGAGGGASMSQWSTAIGGTRVGSGWGPGAINQTIVCTFYVPVTVTFANMEVIVLTGDAGANHYDYGIYSGNPGGTGTLVADVAANASTGFTPLGTTSPLTRPVLQGPTTINPGRYWFAMTADATVGKLDGGNSGQGFPGEYCSTTNIGASTNGKLPATLTLPAINNATAVVELLLY